MVNLGVQFLFFCVEEFYFVLILMVEIFCWVNLCAGELLGIIIFAYIAVSLFFRRCLLK